MDSGEVPWYATGLSFRCTRCGDCCRTQGDRRHVFLTAEDIGRLAAHLSLDRAELLHRCTDREDPLVPTLKWPDGACVFLGADGCGVYQGRPAQCRSWPFWPEHLASREVWEQEVVRTCPGARAGQGGSRVYSLEELRSIARGDAET